jgi:hypothetical protein
MKTTRATWATALWLAATVATMGSAGPANADPAPETPPCDIQQLAVGAGGAQPGLGHRAILLNFTLQPDIAPCEMTGYPTVQAEVPGAASVPAEQTPNGYLGGATPGKTVTLDPGRGAHAMLEWTATGDSTCTIYGPNPPDMQLRVIPPGMWQIFTIPLSVGRNEGLCNLQVHPLAGD